MNATDKRDAILHAQCPTVMVPKYGMFETLTENGHRFLAAADGLWLELRRPWMYLRQQIAAEEYGVKLPYGEMNPVLSYAWEGQRYIEDLLGRFIDEARAASPNEHAAWLVWNERELVLEYRQCIVLDATAGHIRYQRPRCEPHEHACVDMHSHGAAPAFFSDTDDADDAGEVKFSFVVGNLEGDELSICTRVCALGMFLESESAEA